MTCFGSGLGKIMQTAATQLPIRQESNQLRENCAALVHEPLWPPSNWRPAPVAVQIAAAKIRRKPLRANTLLEFAKYFTGH
jgi:hypothetical protein